MVVYMYFQQVKSNFVHNIYYLEAVVRDELIIQTDCMFNIFGSFRAISVVQVRMEVWQVSPPLKFHQERLDSSCMKKRTIEDVLEKITNFNQNHFIKTKSTVFIKIQGIPRLDPQINPLYACYRAAT